MAEDLRATEAARLAKRKRESKNKSDYVETRRLTVGRTIYKDGAYVRDVQDITVRLEICLDDLFTGLGTKALGNKSKRAKEFGGSIVATIVKTHD